MELIENTIEFLKAIETGNWFQVESTLDDDFKFHGPTPDPINKNDWLNVQRHLREAFPDWSFHISQAEQGGTTVFVDIHITGTHTQPLSIPLMGIKNLPPTFNTVNLPIERAALIWKGGKIIKIESQEGYQTGISGILEQLGLE